MQPKFDAEVAELRKLKAAETNDPNAKIKLWDFRYYQNQLKKQKYASRCRSVARLLSRSKKRSKGCSTSTRASSA